MQVLPQIIRTRQGLGGGFFGAFSRLADFAGGASICGIAGLGFLSSEIQCTSRSIELRFGLVDKAAPVQMTAPEYVI